MDDISEWKEGKWVWCQHCERAFHWHGVYGRCGYRGCNGTILDFHSWEEVREHNRNYPKVPVFGVRYGANGRVERDPNKKRPGTEKRKGE